MNIHELEIEATKSKNYFEAYSKLPEEYFRLKLEDKIKYLEKLKNK